MQGELIGNFQIIRRLGTGGMGEVWLAEHKDIHTKVAIKFLLPHISAHKHHVQRFFNEAVAVSKIKHAGIAKIFDVGFREAGEAYLVMEFLEGEPLSSRIAAQGKLPLGRASDIARQIASVLEATHDAGIIHRDLKPDNVFLVADAELDSGERVKILDFGIAKLGGHGITHTGGTMGTPAYMSPEQWKSSAHVDGRADLYSLGCLLFEMLCGRPPFVAESIGELCNLHLHETPPPPSAIAPELPRQVDELVLALLAKPAAQRPSSRDVRSIFSALATGAATSGSDLRVAHTTLGASALSIATERRPRRSAWRIAFAGAVVLAGGAIAIQIGRGDTAEEDIALPEPTVARPAPADAPLALPVARTSRLVIAATPATAEVLLDGARVPNPFRGSFPRSAIQHHVEIKAEGYVAESRWISFVADRELAITLAPEPAPPSPTARPARAADHRHHSVAARGGAPVVVRTNPTVAPAPAKTEPVPGPGSAKARTSPTAVNDGKPTYKGSKAKIITEYPSQ